MKIKPGYYLHFKGHVYLVLGTAVHSETGEDMVIYYSLEKAFVRPLPMFTENVIKDGKEVPRFLFIGADMKEAEAYLHALPEDE